jgi:voltage-dependent potassium channel beta subunit
MTYKRLGASGLKLSTFSIGSWVTFGGQQDMDTSKQCLLAAFEAGVNFFDNAEAYAGGQAEVVVGEVLKDLKRSDLVISSKVFWGGEGPNDVGLNRKHVTEACHAALKRLQTDYLDLYFCHRPDPDTPILETLRAMHALIQQGKVLYWGTSEWTPEQLTTAFELADKYKLEPPTMEQPQYNLFHRENVEQGLAKLVKERGLGTTIWSPLSSGLLTGKYDEGIPTDSRLGQVEWLQELVLLEGRVEKVKALKSISDDLGCTRAQLALAWAAGHAHVSTVITGASRVSQVHENLAALDVIPKLTPEIRTAIEATLV